MSFDFKQKYLILISFFLALSLFGCLPRQEVIKKGGEEVPPSPLLSGATEGQGKMGKILMVIAPNNFRDEEYQKPKAVLENAGYQIVTASKGAQVAKGMLGAVVNVDLDLAQVKIGDYVAVVFIGGSGASVYFDDQIVLNLAKEAVSQGKVVGAICIAPSILANAGILKGKNATSFSSGAENLKAKGVNYTGQSVTADGKIVTANGPEAAEAFGQKILEILRNF